VLGEKLRYAHGVDHVRAALDAAGLVAVALDPASTRSENNIPMSGFVVVRRAYATRYLMTSLISHRYDPLFDDRVDFPCLLPKCDGRAARHWL
jgi:hypothetical protein